MKTSDIADPLFMQAVLALDAGELEELNCLVEQHPRLLRDRLATPGEEGYFKDPFLLWFVADNPVRNNTLPENIVAVTRLLACAVAREAPESSGNQLDYALGLVATGRVPRERGFQLAMMNELISAGAKPGGGMGAIAHGNMEAANYLIDRGGPLSLATALLLDRTGDVDRLIAGADEPEKLTALTAAAFYGKTSIVSYLLEQGVEPNGYPGAHSGFHTHATPLHQAVCSGSAETVRILVEAGARLDSTDKVYSGTPLGWAIYMQTEVPAEQKAVYANIEAYLRNRQSMAHSS